MGTFGSAKVIEFGFAGDTDIPSHSIHSLLRYGQI